MLGHEVVEAHDCRRRDPRQRGCYCHNGSVHSAQQHQTPKHNSQHTDRRLPDPAPRVFDEKIIDLDILDHTKLTHKRTGKAVVKGFGNEAPVRVRSCAAEAKPARPVHHIKAQEQVGLSTTIPNKNVMRSDMAGAVK